MTIPVILFSLIILTGIAISSFSMQQILSFLNIFCIYGIPVSKDISSELDLIKLLNFAINFILSLKIQGLKSGIIEAKL